MAQSQVRGLAFLNLVHIIISVRALEFKHMQIDTLALIMISTLFLALLILCEVLTRTNFHKATVFQCPKRTTKWIKFGSMITQQNLISYRIPNDYFQEELFKNETSILFHYLDWRQK